MNPSIIIAPHVQGHPRDVPADVFARFVFAQHLLEHLEGLAALRRGLRQLVLKQAVAGQHLIVARLEAEVFPEVAGGLLSVAVLLRLVGPLKQHVDIAPDLVRMEEVNADPQRRRADGEHENRDEVDGPYGFHRCLSGW